ncbi:hypothetical protein RRG08_019477 [Elysia crispata]|uniref:Uncharacterized protein n=1 Tax=Elysia crispata TaxID=231223 RepID=A0AAE1A908_9GAST|nr:hypothetical protein RRG08_019477 [Elysia crispata]
MAQLLKILQRKSQRSPRGPHLAKFHCPAWGLFEIIDTMGRCRPAHTHTRPGLMGHVIKWTAPLTAAGLSCRGFFVPAGTCGEWA